MKTYVSKCVLIQLPFKKKEKLLNIIQDLSRWQEWSPWTVLDPQVKVEVSQVNGKPQMTWEGPFCGKGTNTISQLREDGLDYEVLFLKPFKSRARGSMSLTPQGENQTQLEWNMEGNLPFFLFFLKSFFEAMIAQDFNRGMKRMKYLVETGKVPAKLEFDDIPKEVAGFNFLGVEAQQVPLDQLGPTMENDFRKIQTVLKKINQGKSSDNIEITDGYCFYPKVDIKKLLFNYEAGHSFTGNNPEALKDAGLVTKSIPSHRAIKVSLTGSYHFLEDAWAGIMNHSRTLKFTAHRRVPAYEKYIKMGDDPDQYITEVYFPIK